MEVQAINTSNPTNTTRLSPDLIAVLCCPVCSSAFKQASETLSCKNCGRQYPIRDGIFDLDYSVDYTSFSTLDPRLGPVTSRQEADDQAWYNRFYTERSAADSKVSPAIVERYSKLLHSKLFELEKWHELVGNVEGKKVLYLACGIETSAVLLARRGAEVWTLDLAREALRFQKNLAVANGTLGRTHFVTGSCTRLPFRTASFDVLVGIGILHHLQEDLETPCLEAARILKENGVAVFQEPIARSSNLGRLRKLVPVPTPPDASPHWCRPLNRNALDSFARHFSVEAYYFRLFASLDRLFEDTPFETAKPWQRWMTYAVRHIDYSLFRIPGFDHFARSVVFKLTKIPDTKPTVRRVLEPCNAIVTRDSEIQSTN
jgi:SAM-dependent methyltransferase